MSGKSFAVIGLGQFGMTLAKELANADYDVLAIDDKDENIQEIADTVTYAVRADVREPGILKSLGSQYYSHHAGEGSGRPACSGEGNEFPSWPDPGENWC